ncbi:sensor histidine kinase [Nonomuraea sp. bgisy101]|uniref:sensor histidine kinase n=1 Tax=Nonomuraea sp. bgisy101 TaxID=3413784 RepID=UPI003D740ED8
MKALPLWLRLVSATLLLVTLAITLTGGFAVRLLRGYLVERVDQQLATAARPLPFPDMAPRPVEGRPLRLPGLFHMVLLDRQGAMVRTFAESVDVDRPAIPRLTLADVIDRAGRPFDVDSVERDGPEWRAVAVPGPGQTTRVIAVSLGDIDRTVSRLVTIVVGVGGGVLVVLGLACYWLVRRSLRPLGEIERTAAAIAGGDLSRRVPERHRRTEMGRLGRALNGMLAQIERAVRDREAAADAAGRSAELMRRFVADASHELRTPLTSIRGFAELYRQGARDLDKTTWLMDRIENRAGHMSLLVDDLLLLARLDQRRPLDHAPVDLLSLAAGAVIDARTLAPDRDIGFERLDGAEGEVTVLGDEARLGQVIGNLVGNALKHTPHGTPFTVRVGVEAGQAVVEVADQGPGLPGEALDRVFERFYRADPARGLDSGGTGLGLSIAAALTDAHGGTISAACPPGGGALFQVRLPLYSSSSSSAPSGR